MPEAKLFN